MQLMVDFLVRSTILGLIGASISMLTSVVNLGWTASGWLLALIIFLVIFTVNFTVSFKEALEQYNWLNDNGYDMVNMSKEDMLRAMVRKDEEKSKK